MDSRKEFGDVAAGLELIRERQIDMANLQNLKQTAKCIYKILNRTTTKPGSLQNNCGKFQCCSSPASIVF